MAGYTQEEVLEIMVYAESHVDADVKLKYNLSDATLTRWRNGVGVPQPRSESEILQIVTDGLAAERAYTLPEFCRKWNISLTTYYGYKRLHPEACTPATVALPDEQPPARSAVAPTAPVVRPTPPPRPPRPVAAQREPDPPAQNTITAAQVATLAEDCLLDLPTDLLCHRHHVPAGIVHRVRDGNHALLEPDMRRRLQQAADTADIDPAWGDIIATNRAFLPATPATVKESKPMQLVSAKKPHPAAAAKHTFGRGHPLPASVVAAVAADVLSGKYSHATIGKRHGVSHTQVTRVRRGDHPALTDELRAKLLAKAHVRFSGGAKPGPKPASTPGPRTPVQREHGPNLTPEQIGEVVEDVLAGYTPAQICTRRSVSHSTVHRLTYGEHKSMTQEQRAAMERHRTARVAAAAPAAAPPPPQQPAPRPQPAPGALQRGTMQDDMALVKQTLVDYMLECHRLRQRLAQYETVDMRGLPL